MKRDRGMRGKGMKRHQRTSCLREGKISQRGSDVVVLEAEDWDSGSTRDTFPNNGVEGNNSTFL